MLVPVQIDSQVGLKIGLLNFQRYRHDKMKFSFTPRSLGSFLASAILMLFLFAAGASAIAGWMPDSDGLPIDIAAVAE